MYSNGTTLTPEFCLDVINQTSWWHNDNIWENTLCKRAQKHVLPFRPTGQIDANNSYENTSCDPVLPNADMMLFLYVCVLSLCSWPTSWVSPGWVCLVSPPCPSSSSTTCGPPVPPWGHQSPTSPTWTLSAWTFVSTVRECLSHSQGHLH